MKGVAEFSWTKGVNSRGQFWWIHPLKMSTRIRPFWKKCPWEFTVHKNSPSQMKATNTKFRNRPLLITFVNSKFIQASICFCLLLSNCLRKKRKCKGQKQNFRKCNKNLVLTYKYFYFIFRYVPLKYGTSVWSMLWFQTFRRLKATGTFTELFGWNGVLRILFFRQKCQKVGCFWKNFKPVFCFLLKALYWCQMLG